MKKNNAWNIRRLSMSRLSQRPSEQAYYIGDCRILAVHLNMKKPSRTINPKLPKLLPLTLVSPHSLKSGGILIIGQKQDSLDSSGIAIQKYRSSPNLNFQSCN